MAFVTCELIWLNQLLKELKFEETFQMHLKQIGNINIASNPVFHVRTKRV